MTSKSQPNMFARWKSKWSRNALMISLLAHGGFILLALSIVAIHAVMKPKPEITVSVTPPRLERRQLEMKSKPQELQKSSARPQMKPRMVALAPSNMPMPVVNKPPRDPKMLLSRDTSFAQGMGKGMWGSIGQGFGGSGFNVNVPKLFSGRCNPQDRFRLLRVNGAGPEVDEAVTSALDWFKRTQNEDGSWGEDEFKPAMTGFALLAFMGRCETDKSPKYGPTVNRAIQYLVQMGRENDGKLYEVGTSGGWNQSGKLGEHFPYGQAIAALGLAETLTLTQRAEIRPVLEKAIQIIIDGQNPDNGGWMYNYVTKGQMDLSVSVWQIQALKAAKLAGIKNPGLEGALKKAFDVLVQIQQEDGSFPYRSMGPGGKNDGKRGSMTGGALVALILDGRPVPKDVVQKGVDYILENDMVVDAKQPNFSVYHWYYNTYALFLSGDRWNLWNDMFREQVLSLQTNEGNWPKTNGTAWLGGGDGPNWETYRTALCTLMLEVYYRYLPSAKL